jgi:Zn-finger nucleic acid-binding protein
VRRRQVHPRQLIEAPTFKCSACGAPAQAGDFSCRYCGAGIATLRCSRCFQMNMAEARRCSGCGAELGVIIESEVRASQCSECLVPLEALTEPAGTLLACRRCGGQFVEHALLRGLLEQYETTGLAVPDATYHQRVPKTTLERVHYRPCAICRRMMNRKNFGGSSGVIVDVCAKHGTWFDAGELPQVFEFVQTGGLVRERQREQERQRLAQTRSPEQVASGVDSARSSFDSLSRSHTPEHSGFASDLLAFIVDVLKG